MSYELDMKVKGDLLHNTLRGVSHSELVVSDFQVMLESCREHGLNKVLIDYRALEGFQLHAGEVFQYVAAVKKLYITYLNGGGIPLRIVYLSPDHVDLDKEFSQTVAENMGFPAMLTTDPDEAWEWLGAVD